MPNYKSTRSLQTPGLQQGSSLWPACWGLTWSKSEQRMRPLGLLSGLLDGLQLSTAISNVGTPETNQQVQQEIGRGVTRG